jgi:hypothetical protein
MKPCFYVFVDSNQITGGRIRPVKTRKPRPPQRIKDHPTEDNCVRGIRLRPDLSKLGFRRALTWTAKHLQFRQSPGQVLVGARRDVLSPHFDGVPGAGSATPQFGQHLIVPETWFGPKSGSPVESTAYTVQLWCCRDNLDSSGLRLVRPSASSDSVYRTTVFSTA